MNGIIPTLEKTFADMGKTIQEIFYGKQGVIEEPWTIKTASDVARIDVHTIRSLKTSNWRNSGKRR